MIGKCRRNGSALFFYRVSKIEQTFENVLLFRFCYDTIRRNKELQACLQIPDEAEKHERSPCYNEDGMREYRLACKFRLEQQDYEHGFVHDTIERSERIQAARDMRADLKE
jgi:hypothetical protein